MVLSFFFFFKQKTAYEMRISDWSSDVCSSDLNIMVTNTPGVLTEDTADMTMALILFVPRRLAEGEKLVRCGQWAGWSPSGMLGHRTGRMALGIIGMGRIGQAVVCRARALGLSLFYLNRRRQPQLVEEALGGVLGPTLAFDLQGWGLLTNTR